VIEKILGDQAVALWLGQQFAVHHQLLPILIERILGDQLTEKMIGNQMA
jgi:hypothetical protein